MKYCMKCGTQNEDGAKRCTNCGNLFPEPKPDFIASNLPDPDDWHWDEPKKRQKKSHHSPKRKVGAGCGCLVVIVVVAAVITALCMLFSSGKSKNDIAVKPESSAAEQSDESGVFSPELFQGILEDSFQDQDGLSDVSVQYDSDLNYYTVNLTADGISMDTIKLKLTGNMQKWNDMRSGIEDTSRELHEKMMEYGLNASICINVVNDLNSDRVLLSVIDGKTIYDYMKD